MYIPHISTYITKAPLAYILSKYRWKENVIDSLFLLWESRERKTASRVQRKSNNMKGTSYWWDNLTVANNSLLCISERVLRGLDVSKFLFVGSSMVFWAIYQVSHLLYTIENVIMLIVSGYIGDYTQLFKRSSTYASMSRSLTNGNSDQMW